MLCKSTSNGEKHGFFKDEFSDKGPKRMVSQLTK